MDQTKIAKTTYKNYVHLRDAAGLRDFQVADQANVLRIQLSAWNKKDRVPKFLSLYRVAKVLNCSVEDIYQGLLDS